ncbi:thiol reductant ABC exporter subunit CydC [Devosia sp.]|uniref:thiol reductant ABC exporter subunit CydC n=1 Tax=Devosia sp. TaxID=1871048 RepID=UPI001B2960D6|nr:thiol reductant ABC exporter subunit CydC [Devosia sp.]MBO9589181.1 thiol reductant ABC exporter subunit CydC [Devosia sp.]
MSVFAMLAPLFRRRLGALTLALLLSSIALAAGIALLGTSGWFITATALTTLGLGFNLFVPSSLVRAFSFIRILARYGERFVGHNATLRLLSDLRGWLFSALFPRLPLSDRSIRHGDLVSRLTADVDALDVAFLVAIGPMLGALLMGVAVTGVLVVFLPSAALVYALAVAGAIFVVPATLVISARKVGRDVVSAAADTRIAVYDAISGHADLTILGVLGTAKARFSAFARHLSERRLALAALTGAAAMAVQVLAAVALVGTLWTGLIAHQAGALDPAVFVGLVLAVLGSFEATAVIVRSVGKSTAALAAAERLTALANLPPAIIDPAQPLPFPEGQKMAFSDVHFSYDSGAPVLNGVTLSIAPGERIAITGPSGGGKSTLLRLLLRLNEPQCGDIRIGTTALHDIAAAQVHAHTALLSQDSPVFIDTIRNNLRIARPLADDEAIWAALGAAKLEKFVATLPEGLDTVLGESGRTLSVGQMRRLCLARTLLSDAPIILLDEPTNALDRASELSFFETLAGATKGRTLIMVTHAAIPEGTVDRVLEIRNGRLSG